MSLPALLPALIALALALWFYLVFALVMEHRRHAARRTEQPYAGLRDTAQVWSKMLRAPEYRGARRRVALVSLALLALLLLRAFL
ncbi:hypothetical protein ACGYLX_08440 [Sulfitobacter sp. 1A13496]|uniref:hypothetical protein n=1 Tax=Sulfitobacter sp. 1A13496 TaxID=3368596 RepID=UPI00374601A4